MIDVIFNSRTKDKMAPLEKTLPHALLLTGERGVGLPTAARFLAKDSVAAVVKPTNTDGEVDSESGSISVATIRGLYEQSRAKKSLRQVFILDGAHRMSLGAQTAFLKLLEEPGEYTHFILTSHSPQLLLPTIRSRAQTLIIEPISKQQTDALLDSRGITEPKKRQQLHYLAGGRPAEIMRLIDDEAYFKEQAELMVATRTFLSGSLYEKLCTVHAYQKSKSDSLRLIDSALMVTRRNLNVNPQPDTVKRLDALLAIRENIDSNCSARLQLTAFVLQ